MAQKAEGRLGNGGAFGDMAEDHVGVVTAWEMPDLLSVVRPEHIARVIAAVKEGPGFRVDPRATDWIGYKVAEVIGVDLADRLGRETVKRAIAMWLQSKVLAKEKRQDDKRMLREYFIVGPGWEE